MRNPDPHVTIIILNWNSWADTIECVESALKLKYNNFNIILIDNHSDNESVEKITNWLNGTEQAKIRTQYPELIEPYVNKPVQYKLIAGPDLPEELEILRENKVLFIQNSSNLGFAVANNQAMDLAYKIFNSEYFFLLNNDTVIESEALDALVKVMAANKSVGVSQSTIYTYEMREEIANAGGRILFWGQTKYYKNIKPDELKSISFINGCALCIRHSVVQSYGKLSDKFFFGEEDFEFSLRLNRANVSMICAGNSRVYHKMGTSSDLFFKSIKKKMSLHVLNRLVNLKTFYPKYIWYIWKYITLFYLFMVIFTRYNESIGSILILLRKLDIFSNKLTDVRKENAESFLKALA
jgi:GT2 family glycosyltransferase